MQNLTIPIREVLPGDQITNYAFQTSGVLVWTNPPCRWLVHSVEPHQVTYSETLPDRTHVFWDDKCPNLVVQVERP